MMLRTSETTAIVIIAGTEQATSSSPRGGAKASIVRLTEAYINSKLLVR